MFIRRIDNVLIWSKLYFKNSQSFFSWDLTGVRRFLVPCSADRQLFLEPGPGCSTTIKIHCIYFREKAFIVCSMKCLGSFLKISLFCLDIETVGKCFGNNKNVLFLNANYKIIEQEMNKMAIHTHVIFKPRNIWK